MPGQEEDAGVIGYLRKLFHFMQYEDPEFNTSYDDFMNEHTHADPYYHTQHFLN